MKRRIKNPNVQEQNVLKLEKISRSASYFRSNPDSMPLLIREHIVGNGVDLENDLILHSDMSGYEDSNWHQVLVMNRFGVFTEFDITLTDDGSMIEESTITDVTSRHPIDYSAPGTQRSFGALCMDALNQLSSQAEEHPGPR